MPEEIPPTSILVVDDDPRDMAATMRILNEAGYFPETVGSGDEAVEIFESGRTFDLIVTDIVMRGANGFDVVREAIARDPNSICITATSFGSLEAALDSLRFGAYSFAVKPLNSAEFLHVVRRGLEKRRLTKELLLRNEQLLKLNAELEARVRAATQKLEEMNLNVLNRMSTLMEVDQLKTAFLGNVTHDLRNPLTTIRGYISHLLYEPEIHTAEDRAKCLAAIDKASAHMEYLVRQLLEAAQLTSGTVRLAPKDFSGRELIEECVVLNRVQAEAAGLELRFEADASADAPFHGDRGRLLQVLNNLVGNACKFTPRGGRIVLSLRRDGAEMHFAVTDTGPGISAEHREKIFDRFFQADGQGEVLTKGLGLGLNIAKEIVALHGGRLWVESEPGQGAQFHFTIPPAPPPAS